MRDGYPDDIYVLIDWDYGWQYLCWHTPFKSEEELKDFCSKIESNQIVTKNYGQGDDHIWLLPGKVTLLGVGSDIHVPHNTCDYRYHLMLDLGCDLKHSSLIAKSYEHIGLAKNDS